MSGLQYKMQSKVNMAIQYQMFSKKKGGEVSRTNNAKGI